MKTYRMLVEESLNAEMNSLMEEALLDEEKLAVLKFMLEDNENTASKPGIAMVSDNEPVSPKYRQKSFGKGVWRRKKKKPSDLMEMALKKSKKATTGHLEHVGDYLYHGDPHVALKHMDAMHNRFKGKMTKGHEPSLKIDGGMSIVAGRHHDGTHFVRTKHGNENVTFTSEDDIHKTGKEHYVKHLVPLLRHVKNMNIKPGRAFQADLVHHGDDGGTAKPNTITYKVKKGKNLTLAAHSEYSLGSDEK